MSRKEAEKIVSRFADFLKEKKFPLFSIYLFGSYAKGKGHKFSDIDVAVVSKMKRRSEKREDSLMLWRHEIDSRIEPHFFTMPQFKNTSLSLVSEIKKTGIKIV